MTTRLRSLGRDERGFSLVEMMVVVLILSILLGVFYAFLFGGERASRHGREWLEMNEEARLAMERLSRELREADVIYRIVGATEIRFGADFNASGGGPSAAEDELLTYRYDAAARNLLISSDDVNFVALARNMSAFSLEYFGSDPYLDTDGDGTVTASEIDTDGTAGFSVEELKRISMVVVRTTVALRGQSHDYRTGIELRNIFG